jgi:uncharacterized RDD family membrane protein YckC
MPGLVPGIHIRRSFPRKRESSCQAIAWLDARLRGHERRMERSPLALTRRIPICAAMSETPRLGVTGDPKPHAYDPDRQPEYFDGVLARRIVAFLIDAIFVLGPILLLALFIFVFGLITLGLGWFLFALLSPIFVIWAVVYTGGTLGSPQSATIGMRTMNLEMRTWYGAPMYFLLGAVHVIFFWVLTTALTPLVLIVGLLNPRRRLLHDFLTGTVVINNEARAASLRRR